MALWNDLLVLAQRAKIEMRPRLVLETRGGDFNNVTYTESTMLPSHPSTRSRAVKDPNSPLLVNAPPFWVAAAVACLFSGFTALSWAEYLRLLAGEVV